MNHDTQMQSHKNVVGTVLFVCLFVCFVFGKLFLEEGEINKTRYRLPARCVGVGWGWGMGVKRDWVRGQN